MATPSCFNAQAIHGFSEAELYAVGQEGAMWQFDGRNWLRRELPASATLTCVKCAPDGVVYVAGHHGTLLRGRNDQWTIIEHAETTDTIWDLEWFVDRVYASSLSNVYRLDGTKLIPVDFGTDRPKSCYQLSVGEGVMWSNGEFDLMSFDGTKWTRIV